MRVAEALAMSFSALLANTSGGLLVAASTCCNNGRRGAARVPVWGVVPNGAAGLATSQRVSIAFANMPLKERIRRGNPHPWTPRGSYRHSLNGGNGPSLLWGRQAGQDTAAMSRDIGRGIAEDLVRHSRRARRLFRPFRERQLGGEAPERPREHLAPHDQRYAGRRRQPHRLGRHMDRIGDQIRISVASL